VKKLPLIVALLVVVGVTGWLGLHHMAQQRINEAVDRFRATMPADETFTFDTSAPLLIGRGVLFHGVTWHRGDVTVTAARLSARGVAGAPPFALHVGSLVLDDVHVLSPRNNASAVQVHLSNLNIPAHQPGESAGHAVSAFTLDDGSLRTVSMHDTVANTTVTFANATLRDFGPGRASAIEMDAVDAQFEAPPQRHVSMTHGTLIRVFLADDLRDLADLGSIPVRSHTIMDLRGIALDDTGVNAHPALRLERLHFARTPDSGAGSSGSLRSVLDLRLHGLTVWPTAPTLTALRLPGYAQINQDLHLHLTTDLSKGTARVDPLEIDAPDVGRLTLRADLDASAAAGSWDDFQRVRFSRLGFDYVDQGLIEHILDQVAARDGISREQATANMLRTLTVPDAPSDAPSARLAQYVSSPAGKTLHMSFDPQSAVDLATLGLDAALAMRDPQVAKALHLDVSTSP